VRATGFALVALLGWPLVVLVVFALRRGAARLARTTAWMLILPVMFLPSNTGYDAPLIPELNKHRLSFLAVAVALQLFHRRQLLRKAPMSWFPTAVCAFLFAGVVGTVLTNREPLAFGPTVLPGLTNHDIPSLTIAMLLDLYLPFVVGQRVFQTERDLRDLLQVLSICGLIYVPLILLEVRLSPQLHRWVYGFHPSVFHQAVRGEGFRAIVFMNHGLSVAMFMFSCVAASVGLARARVFWGHVATWVEWLALLLCKSAAPAVYAAIATLMRFFSARVSARVVLVVVIVVIAYPIPRVRGLIPTKTIVTEVAKVAPARAESLQFRFNNEDALLARAMEKPIFGWGGFGRNLVFADWGANVSVTDGQWIISLGILGFVGFVGFFTLFLGPLFRFIRGYRRLEGTARVLVSTLALMVALFTFDLLPNARSDFLPLFYAGVLFTVSERLRARPSAPASGAEEEPA
jgi:hypothetical protein